MISFKYYRSLHLISYCNKKDKIERKFNFLNGFIEHVILAGMSHTIIKP